MNIEETKKAIEVMQAFVDGKTIQIMLDGVWSDLNGYPPIWNWGCVNYRIKPEPKEIWVNEYTGDWSDIAHTNKVTALESAGQDAVRVAVRYREVIEE